MMPRPEFTAEEQYLIKSLQRADAMSRWNPYTLGYTIGGAILAGFGVYTDSVAMLTWAFLLVCSFRIYEEYYQSKWTAVWPSIIEKYETAIRQSDAEKTENCG